VDLPDQLAQPEKKIVLTKEDVDVPEEATHEGAGAAVDDEISDEDDSVTTRPDPKSALFAAKMALWTSKYHKYVDLGKKRKADHYQRLLLWYPPMPAGHKVLKGFYESLAEEYKNGAHQSDDWTTMWWETVTDEDFDADGDGESDGTDRAAFKAWMDVTESMIAEKRVTLGELEGQWGLKEEKPPEEETPKYEEPAPLQGYPTATPVAQGYTPNYPQAMPVAQPAMPQAQYVRPPAYPGAAPPIYGGAPMMMPGMQMQQPMMMPGMQMGGMPVMQQPMGMPMGMYNPQFQSQTCSTTTTTTTQSYGFR